MRGMSFDTTAQALLGFEMKVCAFHPLKHNKQHYKLVDVILHLLCMFSNLTRVASRETNAYMCTDTQIETQKNLPDTVLSARGFFGVFTSHEARRAFQRHHRQVAAFRVGLVCWMRLVWFVG